MGLSTSCYRRGLLVVVSWAWVFIGSYVTSIVIYYLVEGSFASGVEQLFDLFYEKPYLASYIELVAIGGLQLAISLVCRDDFSVYGLRRENALRSLILGIIPAMVFLILRITQDNGIVYASFGLTFPLNLVYALLAILAYGPLEVFFIIWLIVNTDEALKGDSGRILSPGLLITVTVFGLIHVILSPRGGLPNALWVTIMFLILGLIFKYTKNSIGPMIAWAIINNQVLYLVMGCLM